MKLMIEYRVHGWLLTVRSHDLTGDGLCGSCIINFVTDGIEDAGPLLFGCSGAHKLSLP